MTDFRCFANTTVEVKGIGDGITLIAGDNEEGKSTVLSALQTVLFEKHTVGGEAAREMLPYGAKVQPRIALDFEVGGVQCQLEKAFCQRQEATLTTSDGGRYSGDAAEDKLRQLLEFTPSARGAAKPENRGLQALFWVEQGAAFEKLPITDSVHARLATALEAEVGAVTGGERGRALIKKIEARMANLLTASNRKPTGAYREAKQHEVEARETLDNLAEEMDKLEGKTEALERVREQLERLEADNPIEAANKRLALAREAVKAVEGLEGQLQTSRAELQTATSHRVLAQSVLDRRQEDRDNAEQAARDAEEKAGEETISKQAKLEAHNTFEAAQKVHDEAKAALGQANADAENWRRIADFMQKHDRLTKDEERLRKAETAAKEVSKLRETAAAEAITKEVLEEILQLDEEVRHSQTRLDVMATKLEFVPERDQRALIDGEAPPPGSVTLVEPTDITLDGYGSIRVTPGGDDLSVRREAAEQAEEALRAALADQLVDSAAEATTKAQNRERALADADVLRDTVDAHASEGIDALKESVAALRAEVDALAAVIVDVDVEGLSQEAAAAKAVECTEAAKSVEDTERGASDSMKDAEANVRSANTAANDTAGRRETAVSKASEINTRLEKEAATKGRSDDDLATELAEAKEVEKRAEAKVTDLDGQLREGDPTGVRAEIEAAERGRIAVDQNLQELRGQVRELEGELRALGGKDTAAIKDVAEGELSRAKVKLESYQHEAEALTLLLDTLTEEERVARETFLAPVRDHMQPYLQRLFPDTELVLDDQSLAITHFRRQGQDEPYHRLSIGTREQLAVLVRLAFANLLNEQGQPSLVVLDDALVYSDDRRFEEMQRILDRAAQQLQIIVLTCHERSYFDRGWPTKRLGVG
jgi:chromosome segregation ATPase